jgi:hypothetical protein
MVSHGKLVGTEIDANDSSAGRSGETAFACGIKMLPSPELKVRKTILLSAL